MIQLWAYYGEDLIYPDCLARTSQALGSWIQEDIKRILRFLFG